MPVLQARAENLCPRSVFTGWDPNGGYADYVVGGGCVRAPVPAGFSDTEAAPLLCAGIIGYRALRRAELPPGGRLGIWGFGGSAHLTAQVALAEGAAVHVFTRAAAARELALGLGAASAQDSFDPPPEPLDSAILFAPVGDLVPVALAALDRGGTLAIAGIHLSDIPALELREPTFSRSARCAASRRIPAATPRSSSGWQSTADPGDGYAVSARRRGPGARRSRRRPGQRRRRPDGLTRRALRYLTRGLRHRLTADYGARLNGGYRSVTSVNA